MPHVVEATKPPALALKCYCWIFDSSVETTWQHTCNTLVRVSQAVQSSLRTTEASCQCNLWASTEDATIRCRTIPENQRNDEKPTTTLPRESPPSIPLRKTSVPATQAVLARSTNSTCTRGLLSSGSLKRLTSNVLSLLFMGRVSWATAHASTLLVIPAICLLTLGWFTKSATGFWFDIPDLQGCSESRHIFPYQKNYSRWPPTGILESNNGPYCVMFRQPVHANGHASRKPSQSSIWKLSATLRYDYGLGQNLFGYIANVVLLSKKLFALIEPWTRLLVLLYNLPGSRYILTRILEEHKRKLKTGIQIAW